MVGLRGVGIVVAGGQDVGQGPLAGFLGGVGSFGSVEEVSFPAEQFLDLVEEEELFFLSEGPFCQTWLESWGGGNQGGS